MPIGRFVRAALPFMAATLLPAALPVEAAWPDRPIKLINPYPAGSSSDPLTRVYAEALGRKLGQPVVVENRGGAAGTVGTEVVVKSPPDGYTILATPNSAIVLLPQLRKTPYTASDLAAIAPLGEFIYGMAVLPSLGVKTLAEFVALAKKNPGKYSYSSPGPGSAGNLRGEAFKTLAGIDLLHVPYRSNAESLTDLLAGHITLMADSSTFPVAKEGKVVILAVTSENRAPDFPNVPTVTEAGFPMNLPTWVGVFVPVATPVEIQDKLAAALNELAADEKMRADIQRTSFFPLRSTRPEMQQRLVNEVKSFGDWIKKTGIKIE